METTHKIFEPFDKVLVREKNRWFCDLYSHYNNERKVHVTLATHYTADNDILTYEGNECLVGTTNVPAEEINLPEGEWVMVCDEPKEYAAEWNLRSVMYPLENEIMIQSVRFAYGDVTGYKYFIRFADFNPNNMKETKKHILCVRNGKIIRYKPE